MKKLLLIGAMFLALGAGKANAQECPEDVGAALAEACPCDGPGNSWKNHGQYVKCVVHLRNQLRKAGCLDAEAKRTIASCAARSTCGKDGATLCCVYDTSATCSDTTQGDDVAAGVCSSDGTTPCDTDVQCAVAVGAPKVTRHEDTCTKRGGTPVGGGSVCGGCPTLESVLEE